MSIVVNPQILNVFTVITIHVVNMDVKTCADLSIGFHF